MSRYSEWKAFKNQDPWTNLKIFNEVISPGYMIYMAENQTSYNLNLSITLKEANNVRLSKFIDNR